jgi:hypothetical protein
MRRILLFLAALLAAFWWLRRGKRSASDSPAPTRGAPNTADPLVRDRVCNTFLPRSRALVVQQAGEDLFFCSKSCLEKHSVPGKGR